MKIKGPNPIIRVTRHMKRGKEAQERVRLGKISIIYFTKMWK
jgi:hypothetical protein